MIEGLDLVVAADNGASTVVAGPWTEVETLVRRAGADGVTATRLEVSHAFHSPAVRQAVAPFTICLDKAPFTVPVGPVYSTVTGTELSAGTDLRRHLAAQITDPVRFREALDLLAAECDLLVEAGPGHSLATLATAHLGGSPPAVSVDSRRGRRAGPAGDRRRPVRGRRDRLVAHPVRPALPPALRAGPGARVPDESLRDGAGARPVRRAGTAAAGRRRRGRDRARAGRGRPGAGA
ncbi:acyltransferase domain-containing protein [Nonomuraea ferruginea]